MSSVTERLQIRDAAPADYRKMLEIRLQATLRERDRVRAAIRELEAMP